MYGIATTTLTVYRGSTINAYGDPVPDNTTPVLSGVLAGISEVSHVVMDDATQTPRQVRRILGVVSNRTDIRPGDRVHDTKHNLNYWVHDVVSQQQPGYNPDLEIELRRVT